MAMMMLLLWLKPIFLVRTINNDSKGAATVNVAIALCSLSVAAANVTFSKTGSGSLSSDHKYGTTFDQKA